MHSSVRDVCTTENRVNAQHGNVITISSSSVSARMHVSVQGFNSGNVNYLYSAAERVEKIIGDSIGSDDIEKGDTSPTENYVDERSPLARLPPYLLYICLAGSAAFCLIAVMSCVIMTRKW